MPQTQPKSVKPLKNTAPVAPRPTAEVVSDDEESVLEYDDQGVLMGEAAMKKRKSAGVKATAPVKKSKKNKKAKGLSTEDQLELSKLVNMAKKTKLGESKQSKGGFKNKSVPLRRAAPVQADMGPRFHAKALMKKEVKRFEQDVDYTYMMSRFEQ